MSILLSNAHWLLDRRGHRLPSLGFWPSATVLLFLGGVIRVLRFSFFSCFSLLLSFFFLSFAPFFFFYPWCVPLGDNTASLDTGSNHPEAATRTFPPPGRKRERRKRELEECDETKRKGRGVNINLRYTPLYFFRQRTADAGSAQDSAVRNEGT